MNEKNILISVKLDENKVASRLKEIKTAINNLEKDNTKLQNAINKLGDSTGNFSKAIETNNTRLKALQGEYNTLESKINSNNNATKNLTDQTTNLSKSEEKLSSSIKNVSDDIRSNESALNDIDSALNKGSQDTESFINSQQKLGDAFENNVSKTEAFETELEQANKKINDFKNNVSQIESKEVNIKVNVEGNNNLNANSVSDTSSVITSSVQNAQTDVTRLDMLLKQTISTTNLLKQGFISLGAEGAASISILVNQIAGLASGISSGNYLQAATSFLGILGNLGEQFKKIKLEVDGVFSSTVSALNNTFETGNKGVSGFKIKFKEVIETLGADIKYVGDLLSGIFRNLFEEGKSIRDAFRDARSEAESNWDKMFDLKSARSYYKNLFDNITHEYHIMQNDIQRNNNIIRKLEADQLFAGAHKRIEIENQINDLKLENLKKEAEFATYQVENYEQALLDSFNIKHSLHIEDINDIINQLSNEEIEQLTKLREYASSANSELRKAYEEEIFINGSTEYRINLLEKENSIKEKKRSLDEQEIDLAQKIVEIRAAGGDEAEIIELQKQALQSKIDLLKDEIELQKDLAETELMTGSGDSELNKLHSLQMELKRTTNEYNNLANGITNASQRIGSASQDLKGAGGILDRITDSVGESSQALSLLGFTGAASIKRVSVGLKALGKLFTTWPLVAIVAIITAIVTVVKGVSKAFKENQELMDRLTQTFSVFEPILNLVGKSFEFLAKIITGLVEGMANLARVVLGTQEAFEEQIRETKRLEQATKDLDEAKRKFTFDEEERAQKIAELNRVVKDSELKSLDERIAAQNRINEIKEESLKVEKKLADQEMKLNSDKIKYYERLREQGHKLSEEEQQDYDDLIKKVDELRLTSIKAANALVNIYSESKDAILGLLSELTTKEIEQRLEQAKLRQSQFDAELTEIKRLQTEVMHRGKLEEAVLFLREKGVYLTQEEEKSWEVIYDRLIRLNSKPFLTESLNKEIKDLEEALARSKARDAKNKTTKTNTSSKKEKTDEEKKAEELAKYWEKALDDATKGLSKFHQEIRDAQKDFKELSMTPLEIFDANLDETMKTLDTRKAEIQAKIFEIQNTKTNTEQEKYQQETSIAYYTEMYQNFEELKTQITLKAAKERSKVEEEELQNNLEKQLDQIERHYREMRNDTMMEGAYDMAGGGTSYFFSGIDNVTESKIALEQARKEFEALNEAFSKMDKNSENYAEMADRIVEANMKIIDSEKNVVDSVLQGAASYLNSVDQISGSIQSLMSAKKKEVQNSKKTEGEKAALIREIEDKERGMAVAQIAFSTASAIAQVVADAAKAGWPAMIPILIAGVATVISGIAQAKSAMAGFNEGGIVPGTSYSGDNVMIRTNSDEMILTKKQQKELFNIANGRGGNGNNYAVLVKAFSSALLKMPSPVLDYSEFSTFTKNVGDINNLVKIK